MTKQPLGRRTLHFNDQGAAEAFAGELSAAVTKYGPDGVAGTFDYSRNPYYGTWSDPRGPSAKSKRSPAVVQIKSTNSSTAASYAKRTVSEGYGVYLTYDLQAGNSSNYLSAFTKNLYGSTAKYTP